MGTNVRNNFNQGNINSGVNKAHLKVPPYVHKQHSVSPLNDDYVA